MTLITRTFGLVLLASCLSTAAMAQDAREDNRGNFGVGLAVGTTGATVEAKFAPSRHIMLRGGYNFLDFETEQSIDDIDYDGDLKFSTFSAFVDVAPFGNGFVLSGGAYLGEKQLDLVAVPTQSVEIGGELFTAAEVGTLTGEARVADFAPYAGIGYDSFVSGSSAWAFNIRAGVMFTGSPEAELFSADGTLSSDPRLRAELDAEVQEIVREAEDYKYYPVVSLGLTRRF